VDPDRTPGKLIAKCEIATREEGRVVEGGDMKSALDASLYSYSIESFRNIQNGMMTLKNKAS
jgi:hypothetical protein